MVPVAHSNYIFTLKYNPENGSEIVFLHSHMNAFNILIYLKALMHYKTVIQPGYLNRYKIVGIFITHGHMLVCRAEVDASAEFV